MRLTLIVCLAACGAKEPAHTAVTHAPPLADAHAIDAAPIPDAPPDATLPDALVVPAPIKCKTVNDCWMDGMTPIARPPNLRGRKFAPCHDGETPPLCTHGQCAAGGVYPC